MVHRTILILFLILFFTLFHSFQSHAEISLGPGPANDECQDAEIIFIFTPCVPVPISGSTVDACPENFIGDCNQNMNPTIWYEFTTLGGTTSLEFSNVNGRF